MRRKVAAHMAASLLLAGEPAEDHGVQAQRPRGEVQSR